MDLFCYGSLIFPEVMQAVTGKRFAGERAQLDGFARYRVRDATYPGLVAEPGACTRGVLWRGVDAAALAALDRFEGALYERHALAVRDARGVERTAHVYVVPPERRLVLSDEPWDEAEFAARELAAFLRRVRTPERGV